jgi:fimbrial chaperone protein
MRSFRSAALAALLVFPLLLAQAGAADFSVEPVVVTLPAGSTTQITVNNRDQTTVTFQVKGNAWNESVDGTMELAPAPNLVYFPKQFTLAPGESRKIRLGNNGPAPAKEEAYRVFVEELPPANLPAPTSGERVVVRTQVGLAVFVAPKGTATISGAIQTPTATAKHLTIAIANTGNTHFELTHVHVTAKDKSGATLLTAELPGWYVLAGNTRNFTFALPDGACANIGSVTVDAPSDRLPLSKTFDAINATC